MTTRHPHGMTAAMTFLFAVSSGVAVGNLYWAQPLLAEIAAALGISPAAAGSLITATQVGYAMGVFLLVPLGDVVNRRRLVPSVMALSAVALLVTGLAPTYESLL